MVMAVAPEIKKGYHFTDTDYNDIVELKKGEHFFESYGQYSSYGVYQFYKCLKPFKLSDYPKLLDVYGGKKELKVDTKKLIAEGFLEVIPTYELYEG